MPILSSDTPTSQLEDLATSLFGEEWAGAVSRFTGISLRTCQRAKAAAADQQEERRAGGILKALVERLDSLTPAIETAFYALEPDANPFSTLLLPNHAGVVLTMDKATSKRLHSLLHRASRFRSEFVDEKLLLALAYDLRKAHESLYKSQDQPAPPAAISVRALWPLLLFQLKLLRTTCGYIPTGVVDGALLDDLQDVVLSALHDVYLSEEDLENVIEAWHDLGVDPHDPSFDARATARAAWFLDATAERRHSSLIHLLESMTDLYAAMDGELDDGRPSIAELGVWLGEWPEKDF